MEPLLINLVKLKCYVCRLYISGSLALLMRSAVEVKEGVVIGCHHVLST